MAAAKRAPTAAKVAKSKGKPAAKVSRGRARRAPSQADVVDADPALFDPLTPGEVADALRTLTEDKRLSVMAKVGRYRVICCEPLVVKPPNPTAGHRLARVVVFDYAADRAVDACVDLDRGRVTRLDVSRGQPMLSRDEEAYAISIAMVDERVRGKLSLGDTPQSTMHYWGRTSSDLSYSRRSAAVVFGRPDGHASLIAIVDLLDDQVTQVIPAELW